MTKFNKTMVAILLGIVLSFTMCKESKANPFLTCDCSRPEDAVTYAEIKIKGLNGDQYIQTLVGKECGTDNNKVICISPSVTICYDTKDLPAGTYETVARWGNAQGRVSADSNPLEFTILGIPSAPTIQKLTVIK